MLQSGWLGAFERSMRGRALGVALLAGIATACVDMPGGGEPSPVPLKLGLSSYATLEQIRGHFGPDTSLFVSERKTPARGTCPRFDRTTVKLSPRAVDGFTGRVQLQLINGRLLQIEFFPDDIEAYVAWLQTQGIVFDGHTAHPAPGVVMSLTAKVLRPRSIRWGDASLVGETSEWVERCG